MTAVPHPVDALITALQDLERAVNAPVERDTEDPAPITSTGDLYREFREARERRVYARALEPVALESDRPRMGYTIEVAPGSRGKPRCEICGAGIMQPSPLHEALYEVQACDDCMSDAWDYASSFGDEERQARIERLKYWYERSSSKAGPRPGRVE